MIKFFTKNIGIKILALIFATSLWVYVTSGEFRTASFPGSIPIQIRNIPKETAIVDKLENVELKIKAPYSSWRDLSADSFQAYIDLAGLKVGIYEMDVKIQISDSQVQIVEKTPSRVTIHLDPIKFKKVPIAVKIEGNAGEGFASGEPEVDPKEVEVKGAETIIEEVTQATAVIVLSGEMDSLKKSVRLIAFDSKGEEIENISFTPSVVGVNIPIERAANIKTVGIKVNIIGQPKPNYWVSKVTTLPATVSIKGDEEIIKKITYLETSNVDVSGISSGISKTASLILSQGVELVGNEEGVLVKVYISAGVTTRTIPGSFRFASNGSSSNTVNVTVSGSTSILNSLGSESIVINIGEATGSVTITREMISVPSEVEIIDFSPKVINVIVE